MTRSQADRLSKTYRLLASRLHDHLWGSGKAKDAEVTDYIKAAHDRLCEAARIIERNHRLY